MLSFAVLIVAAAVVLLARRGEPRLVLLGAGFLLCLVGGDPLRLPDAFAQGMIATMVAPICAAMGFACVVQAAGCDRALVEVLLAPVQRIRPLLLPGGILAAYLVNAAIPSQTSTAAALGPVLLPLLLAAGIGRETAAAALILGASFGGDLLSPGSQDVQAVAGAASLPALELGARVLPPSAAGVVVAALVFGWQHRIRPTGGAEPPGGTSGAQAGGAGPLDARPHVADEAPPSPAAALNPDPPSEGTAAPLTQAGLQPARAALRVVRACVPVIPILLLLAANQGWPPLAWLIAPRDGVGAAAGALPVVRAMLIGCCAAALAGGREGLTAARKLFEGMGIAYANIISLTITAACFGAGIQQAGLGEALLRAAEQLGPVGLRSLAVLFPALLALLSGSGSGPILAYAQAFLSGAAAAGPSEHLTLGTLACLAGAVGRTASPVAAVVVYSSGLAGVSPFAALRPLLPALGSGALAALAVAAWGHG